ncbi:MAG: TIGR02444 family protein [Pseudomonadota bacterium]
MQLIPNHAFWNFSVKFYNDDSIASALHLLQTKHQLNINIILYCIYCGLSGRGAINSVQINQLNHAVEVWHRKITKAIRQLNRRVKQYRDFDAKIHELIFSTELLTEQIEQSIIVDTVPVRAIKRRANQLKIDDAIKSLHHYFESKKINLLRDTLIAVKTILTKAFPKLLQNDNQLDLFA